MRNEEDPTPPFILPSTPFDGFPDIAIMRVDTASNAINGRRRQDRAGIPHASECPLDAEKTRPAEAERVVDLVGMVQAALALIGWCRSPFSIAFCPRLSAGPKGR